MISNQSKSRFDNSNDNMNSNNNDKNNDINSSKKYNMIRSYIRCVYLIKLFTKPLVASPESIVIALTGVETTAVGTGSPVP